MKTRPLTILVSPLDWGLGHASRMIPIIVHCMKDGHRVVLAGSGRSAELLRKTFTGLKFVPLPCYPVHMGSGKFSCFELLFQLPAMIASVFREHRMVKGIVRDEAADIVISDNRYGLYGSTAYSVFVTHQVSPVLPAGFRWLEFPLYLIIRSFIKRFDQCWIPDFPEPAMSVSGSLSHRFKTPSNASYVGLLSRFSQLTTSGNLNPEQYGVAVILSGPEPQVSEFEKNICVQLSTLQKPAILIRGMRNKPIAAPGPLPACIRQVTHLDRTAFSEVVKNSGIVISRSGYTGIMDFITLGIPAILVPAPGQSEQEYLAGWLSEKGWFTCVKEEDLDLVNLHGINSPGTFPFSVKQDFKFLDNLYRKYHKNSQ